MNGSAKMFDEQPSDVFGRYQESAEGFFHG